MDFPLDSVYKYDVLLKRAQDDNLFWVIYSAIDGVCAGTLETRGAHEQEHSQMGRYISVTEAAAGLSVGAMGGRPRMAKRREIGNATQIERPYSLQSTRLPVSRRPCV